MNNRFPRMLLAALLVAPALCLATAVPAGPSAPVKTHADHDAHAAHAAPESVEAPEVRWASDAPLREGMRRVRAATEALEHAAHSHLDAGQVQAVAKELDAAVQDMFARCELPPEPDAALHPLLANVLQASAALSSGRFDADAKASLEGVLTRYALFFEDPEWNAHDAASH